MSILVLTSDTLIGTPASGNLEYNGQFYGTDSNASRAQMQRVTQGTAVASTSGTSIDFTGLPAWCKKITVMFSGVSTNSTSNWLIQLGDSGGVETTGYDAVGLYLNASTTNYTSTAGFILPAQNASSLYSGFVTLNQLSSSSNIWTAFGSLCWNIGAPVLQTTGSKTLSGALDRVRITTVAGTNTFDAGSINIMYEG